MSDAVSQNAHQQGLPFWSHGFRPFFFSAALFAGIAIPVWVLMQTGTYDLEGTIPQRAWHIHEMIFGFLACVMTGFLLTALPNWTDSPPMSGVPLMGLLTVWVIGRLAMSLPWFSPLLSVLVDSVFLVVVAVIVWQKIMAAKAWDRLPMGVLISLFASANVLFHVLWMSQTVVDVAVRMALTIMMVLLALIGGKIIPSFTEDFFAEKAVVKQLAAFSSFDGFSILLLVVTGVAWMIAPEATGVGYAFLSAGVLHLFRLTRWYGWLTASEPLVLILHIGYGWLAMSFLILGTSILGIGIDQEDALHALTAGAVGVMTLAVMTRASLGHTGRAKHAGSLTLIIFLLVNVGAALRVFGPSLEWLGDRSLVWAGGCWSGAYLLFAMGYGHMLFGKNLEEV